MYDYCSVGHLVRYSVSSFFYSEIVLAGYDDNARAFGVKPTHGDNKHHAHN